MKVKTKHTMNLFYIPALILFISFVVYPFTQGIKISFTNWNGYSQAYKYIGIDNYIRFFKDKNILQAFINTIIYGFGSTLFQNIIGLAYALLLNTTFKGRLVLRTIIYMPVMIAGLVMGYIMYFLVQYDSGALNDIMMLFGKAPIDWMGDGPRAVLIMTFINILQFVGISMVLYLAGLQNIPQMYYEAASIDGVNAWGQFKYITWPLLLPAMSSAVVINLIGGLKLFDIITALTAGGPGYSTHSLSTMVANMYFREQLAGYSATIGIFAFIFIMIVSNVVTRYFDKRQVEM